ncbi:hypothetical protein FDECE_16312 [Fusarium decemcellulare]|nr:hypothetical protein FDECE_16312 [Fusarium decemcellulare]
MDGSMDPSTPRLGPGLGLGWVDANGNAAGCWLRACLLGLAVATRPVKREVGEAVGASSLRLSSNFHLPGLLGVVICLVYAFSAPCQAFILGLIWRPVEAQRMCGH